MAQASVGLKFGVAARQLLRKAFLKMGYGIRRLTHEEHLYMHASYDQSVQLPSGAAETLRLDNPRLRALRLVYREMDLPVCRHTVWSESRLTRELTLPWFRGDNAYVWQFRQVRSEVRLKQYLMLKYVEDNDELGLLDKLEEDGAFGCWAFRYG